VAGLFVSELPSSNGCSNLSGVAQLSFYSAEANVPVVADLAGLLCCHGEITCFGATAARLSVVVAEPWRARALAAAFAERGIATERCRTEAGDILVHTAFRTDLLPVAGAWTRGPAKTVPPGLTLDGASLRLWVMAAGTWADDGYLLGLDPSSPQTHEPLGAALARCGLAATPGVRGGGPGLRVSGRRRLNRLAELVGGPPSEVPHSGWPVVSRVRATG
jgi:hypothetical protein